MGVCPVWSGWASDGKAQPSPAAKKIAPGNDFILCVAFNLFIA
jgi:hypothetical protein